MKKLLFLAVALSAQLALAVSPFELPWMNSSTPGATYKMADHPDGVFVIENYFDGCEYCNMNAANVDALAAKYASNPRVQVLDVGTDDDDASYQDWINRHHPNHPVLNDGGQSLTGELGSTLFPSTYVVDCKGNVTYSSRGTWEDGTADQISAAIDSLLSQHCTND